MTAPLTRRLRPLSLLPLALAALLGAGAAHAGVVTTLADDGTPGTLRSQIAATPAGGAITFGPGLGGTILLTAARGPLSLGQSLTIAGPGAGVLAVDGGSTPGGDPNAPPVGVRVFTVTGGTVSVSGLTIQNGLAVAGSGGGVLDTGSGQLTLTNCVLQGNSINGVPLDGGGSLDDGGALAVTVGTATLTGCTFRGNRVETGNGGGLSAGFGTTLTLTGCTFSGNIAVSNSAGSGGGYGGGVFNFGTMTLTGCTFTGNTIPDATGGGGVYNGGAMTLTTCVLTGNRAPAGGAVYNTSASLTLTACTLTGNISGSDGCVFAGGNTVTLTDDILYGDTGGEISSTTVTATYCDIQGGYAGTGNINADPQFVNAVGGDLHLRAGSPVVGRGTRAAPNFQPTDHDGKPYASPPSIGAYEAQPPLPTHLLWSNPDGRAAFWTVDGQGNVTGVTGYGPYTDTGGGLWSATALATGPDGVSHLLWNNPDGKAALWDVADGGAATVLDGFGPYTDGTSGSLWRASGLSVGPDGAVHLLWSNPDGRAAFWNVNGSGSVSGVTGYGPFTDGASGSLWSAVGISTGPDNVSHLLWANSDGKAAFWNVSDTDGAATALAGYGPYLDGTALWGAVGVSSGPDNVSHLLWSNPDGRAAFWSLSGSGGIGSVTGYGPYLDGSSLWAVQGLATGPDGVSRLLWDNPDGKAALWGLDGSGSPATATGYGPYTDGSSLWSAVGVSAGP